MTFKSFKSFHIWAVYQINTLKHSMLSFVSHPGELKRDLSDF